MNTSRVPFSCLFAPKILRRVLYISFTIIGHSPVSCALAEAVTDQCSTSSSSRQFLLLYCSWVSGTPCTSRQFLRLYCSCASFSSCSEVFSRSRWATCFSSSRATSVVWAVVSAMSIDIPGRFIHFLLNSIQDRRHLVMASIILFTKSELPVK